MIEEWKDIVGYEGEYQISNYTDTNGNTIVNITKKYKRIILKEKYNYDRKG